MNKIALLLLPLSLFAKEYNLKTLVEHALVQNPQIIAKQQLTESKNKEVQVEQSSYWPTLDIGASFNHTTPSTFVTPRDTTSGYAKVQVDIYDGGRKNALVDAKKSLYRASMLEKEAFSKSVTLNIIQHYYTIKKLQAIIFSMQKQSQELYLQIKRIKKFAKAGLATSEDIDKLQAVFDENQYKITDSKLSLQTSMEQLNLLTGLTINQLKQSHLKEPKKVDFYPYEDSKIFHENAKAVDANAKALEANYKPQVHLSDTYSMSHYAHVDSIPGFSGDSFLPNHQNTLILSANMRLFDNGKIKKEKEALKYHKMALVSQKSYALSTQKMQYKLAKSRLVSIDAKRKSAKSALKASKSTYHVIIQKFEAGLVDNIAYLDALNKVTLSQAQYKETLYDYEIAKAIYYYYAGKNPKEYIQ